MVDIEKELERIYEYAIHMTEVSMDVARESSDPEMHLAVSKFMDTAIRALDRLMALRYKLRPDDLAQEIEQAIQEVLARASGGGGDA